MKYYDNKEIIVVYGLYDDFNEKYDIIIEFVDYSLYEDYNNEFFERIPLTYFDISCEDVVFIHIPSFYEINRIECNFLYLEKRYELLNIIIDEINKGDIKQL